MIDAVGQNINVGDFVVIVTPYTHHHSLGRVNKINDKTASIKYIPHYWVYYNESVEYNQKIFDLLCSDRFDSGDKFPYVNHHGNRIDVSLASCSRESGDLVVVSKDSIKNYLESLC